MEVEEVLTASPTTWGVVVVDQEYLKMEPQEDTLFHTVWEELEERLVRPVAAAAVVRVMEMVVTVEIVSLTEHQLPQIQVVVVAAVVDSYLYQGTAVTAVAVIVLSCGFNKEKVSMKSIAIILIILISLFCFSNYSEAKTFAQIINNRIYWIGSFDILPPFHPSAGQFIDITKLSPQPKEGYVYNGTSFNPSPVSLKIITNKELWGRFIDIEKENLIVSTDKKVKRFLFELQMSDNFNLDDAKVKTVINGLETLSLIAVGRAIEILK